MLDRSFVSGPVGGMIGPVGGQMLAISDMMMRKFVEFGKTSDLESSDMADILETAELILETAELLVEPFAAMRLMLDGLVWTRGPVGTWVARCWRFGHDVDTKIRGI